MYGTIDKRTSYLKSLYQMQHMLRLWKNIFAAAQCEICYFSLIKSYFVWDLKNYFLCSEFWSIFMVLSIKTKIIFVGRANWGAIHYKHSIYNYNIHWHLANPLLPIAFQRSLWMIPKLYVYGCIHKPCGHGRGAEGGRVIKCSYYYKIHKNKIVHKGKGG